MKLIVIDNKSKLLFISINSFVEVSPERNIENAIKEAHEIFLIINSFLKIGVYKRQDFKKNPQKYCGTKITDSPLDD
jgi:hypothetical protein